MTPQRLLQDIFVAYLLVVINLSRFVQCMTNLNHKTIVEYTAKIEQGA